MVQKITELKIICPELAGIGLVIGWTITAAIFGLSLPIGIATILFAAAIFFLIMMLGFENIDQINGIGNVALGELIGISMIVLILDRVMEVSGILTVSYAAFVIALILAMTVAYKGDPLKK